MPSLLSEEELLPLRHSMQAASQHVFLPVRNQKWRGSLGSQRGQNAGNSIEFQDQRMYLPGDDPRHINWQAYARTGNLTMKLFSEEVAPKIDLLLDVSESMFLNATKSRRTWELIYFGLESALRMGANLKIFTASPEVKEHPISLAILGKWAFPSTVTCSSSQALKALVTQAPLRTASFRILISDLLYDLPPEEITHALVKRKGKGMILAPYSLEETQPEWNGNVILEDCESSATCKSHISPQVLEQYMLSYQRHFKLWRIQTQRQGLNFARIPSDIDFLQALKIEAIPNGSLNLG